MTSLLMPKSERRLQEFSGNSSTDKRRINPTRIVAVGLLYFKVPVLMSGESQTDVTTSRLHRCQLDIERRLWLVLMTQYLTHGKTLTIPYSVYSTFFSTADDNSPAGNYLRLSPRVQR